jgi:hypothetical protein
MTFVRFGVFTVVTWRMPSCGMLCRVALVRTDVSEEGIAPVIRVTRIGELGTMLAVTSNRSMLQRNTVSEGRMWCKCKCCWQFMWCQNWRNRGMVLWSLHLRSKGMAHSSLVLLVRSVNWRNRGMVLWSLHLRRKGRVRSSLVLLVRSVSSYCMCWWVASP